jgi:hypothetical protein
MQFRVYVCGGGGGGGGFGLFWPMQQNDDKTSWAAFWLAVGVPFVFLSSGPAVWKRLRLLRHPLMTQRGREMCHTHWVKQQQLCLLKKLEING